MNYKKLINNPWFVLLFNTIAFVLMAWTFPIRFEQNDDATMCMIANGVYSGTPDGHLVFINALYGWLLAGLYMLTKTVEWYSLGFSAMQVMAMTGIVVMVLGDKEMKSLWKVVFLVVMYVLWARIVIAFQFTTTTGLLCFSGCLALLQSSRKWRMAGVAAVFVASLLRFEAAAMVGILCAPMYLLKVIKDRKFVYWLAGLLLLVFAGRFADGLFYQQQDWAEYRAYNAVRGFINDNPNVGLVGADLPDGVEEEDWRMLVLFSGDPKVMSLPKMKAIKATIEDRISFRQAVSNMSSLRTFNLPIALVILAVGFCIVMNCRTDDSRMHGRVYALVVSLLMFLLLLAYLASGSYVKHRVFICMLFPIAYQIVACMPVPGRKLTMLSFGVFGLAMALFLVKPSFVRKKLDSYKSVNTEKDDFATFQLPLVGDREGWVYLGAFRSQNLSPFGVKDLRFHPVAFGWTSGIPFQKGKLECHRDLVDSDIVYFAPLDEPPMHFVERIEKNYGIASQLVIVDKNEKYALYKFVSK